MTTINSSLPGSPEYPPGNQVRPNNLDPAEREADHIPNLMRMAFSVRETAEILGVSDKTVRRLIDRKLLHASRALRHLLIPKKEIEVFYKKLPVSFPFASFNLFQLLDFITGVIIAKNLRVGIQNQFPAILMSLPL